MFIGLLVASTFDFSESLALPFSGITVRLSGRQGSFWSRQQLVSVKINFYNILCRAVSSSLNLLSVLGDNGCSELCF